VWAFNRSAMKAANTCAMLHRQQDAAPLAMISMCLRLSDPACIFMESSKARATASFVQQRGCTGPPEEAGRGARQNKCCKETGSGTAKCRRMGCAVQGQGKSQVTSRRVCFN
jgi:hypothetical protein